jgi:ATP-dependent helicase/nuclease subunit A
VPVQYLTGNDAEDARLVSGIIDRLLVDEREVWVIDYKTHPSAREPEARAALLAQYRPQLEHYRQAVARLWPGRVVRAGLLFTASKTLALLEEPPAAPARS